MRTFISNRLKLNTTTNLIISLGAYAISWGISNWFSHLFWLNDLQNGHLILLLIDFILPAILVAVAIIWSKGKKTILQVLPIFFIILLVLVFFNITFIHFETQNYGDNEQLGQAIEAGQAFSRWMLGSSILKSIFVSIWQPLATRSMLPYPADPFTFIRLIGSIFMCVTSILMLYRYPNRSSIVFPLFTPIWLLLASGYNEYYPFIAPIFLFLLVFLSENALKNLSSTWMGVIVASVALLYAGFVPIALLILVIFILQKGWKAGLSALCYCVLFAIMIIVFFWPHSLPNFLKSYLYDLNLGELNTIYLPYLGYALADTPFFAPRFVFSLEHLSHMFYMVYWGGGISFLLFIAGSVPFFRNWHAEKKNFRNYQFISIALLLILEAATFILVIPKYGPVNDIDLFFSVYIIFAFVAGLLFDRYSQNTSPQRRFFAQNIILSTLLGSTAFILTNLIFLGLPIPV